MIVEEYQKRSLYIFLAAGHTGTHVAEQLVEADAGMAVGQASARSRVEFVVAAEPVALIDNHEIVAGTVHFRELQLHRASIPKTVG